jgi:hypothetical protein
MTIILLWCYTARRNGKSELLRVPESHGLEGVTFLWYNSFQVKTLNKKPSIDFRTSIHSWHCRGSHMMAIRVQRDAKL